MCKLNFLPSEELAEDAPFHGFIIVETAHWMQTALQRTNQPLQRIISTNQFQLTFR